MESLLLRQEQETPFLQGTLDVSGNMDLDGTLDVSGDTHLENRLDVSGAAVFDSTVNVTHDFNINSGKFTVEAGTGNTFLQGTLDVSGNMDLDGTLEVSGNAHLEKRLDVSGAAVFDSTVNINNNFDISNGNFTVEAGTGNTFLQGTLDVSGNMDLDGTLDVSGDTHLENRLVVSGGVVLDSTLNVTDNFDINYGKFKVDAGTGNTFLQGTLDVSGNMDLDGTLDVSGDTHLEKRLDVSGAAVFDSTVNINNNFDISNGNFTVEAGTGNTFLLGTLDVSGNMDLDGTLDVSGDTHLEKRLDVSGAAVFDSTVNINNNFDISNGNFTVEAGTGNTFLLGTLDVSGNMDLDGTLDVSGDTHLEKRLDVSGAAVFDSTVNINNNFDISNGKFTVEAESGNTFLLGTLDVSGNMDLDGTLDVSGNTHLEKRLDVSGAVVLDSTLNVNDNFDISYGTFTINAQTGDTRTLGTLDVSGHTLIDNSLIVLGNVGINIKDPTCALDISASDALRIPVGTTGERPSELKTGQIRFNTDTRQFEGYNNNSSWQGLGGVIDIDRNTFISAENNPMEDNNELKFVTKRY